MFSVICFVGGLVLGSFFPNTIRPRVISAWKAIQNAAKTSE